MSKFSIIMQQTADSQKSSQSLVDRYYRLGTKEGLVCYPVEHLIPLVALMMSDFLLRHSELNNTS